MEEKDRKPEVAQRKRDYNYSPPFLAGVISDAELPRVYRILDALFRQVENLGGSLNDDLSLKVRNEHIRIEIAESQDKVDHVITNRKHKHCLSIRMRDAIAHGRQNLRSENMTTYLMEGLESTFVRADISEIRIKLMLNLGLARC